MFITASEARSTILTCFGAGAIGTALGLVLTVAATRSDGDSGLGIILAWLVLAASSVFLAVAVIAWGVSLGVRASGLGETSSAAAPQPTQRPVVRRRTPPADVDPLDPI